MNANPHALRPRLWLLWPLVLVIIVLDQWSKAWFVFKLGTHTHDSFATFAASYFALWGANGGDGAVTAHYFPFRPGIDVWHPWIEFTLTTNTGAAWSMFAGNSFILSGVSLLMACLLFYVWWRSFRYHLSMTWALGGIIGGALGNFLDRFRLKEVVDFIDVKIPLIGRLFPALGDPYDFPIFNVADSCAVIGTLGLALYLVVADIRAMRRRHHPALLPGSTAPGADAKLGPWTGAGPSPDPQAAPAAAQDATIPDPPVSAIDGARMDEDEADGNQRP